MCADYELNEVIDQINFDGSEIVAVVEKGSTWRFFVQERMRIETSGYVQWTDGTPDEEVKQVMTDTQPSVTYDKPKRGKK